MKKRTQVLSIYLLTFFVISLSNSAALIIVDEEWKVKVGDSITYTIDKLYDELDFDGDGYKNTQTNEVTDEDGNNVNVTIKKNSRMKVTITKLNGDATVKREWPDARIVSEETTDHTSVKKTVDNKVHWQEKVIDMSVGDTEAELQGDLVIVNTTTTTMGTSTMTVVKINWKTGWRVYEYVKIYNETQTDYEFEYSGEITAAGGTPGFETGSMLLIIFIITVIISKKRR